MPQLLNIDVFESDGVVVLTLDGEIDTSVCDQFESAMKLGAGRAGRAIVLDLGGVTYMDSSGLRSLIAGGRHAEDHHVRFAIGRSSPAVHEVLQRFGVEETFVTSARATRSERSERSERSDRLEQARGDAKEVRT
jgi:anti-anti-sigma factor